jgi:acylphosphatase
MRFIVYGKVQGVGFRVYVQRAASALGVDGEVWNRRDGAVELVACYHDAAVLQTELLGMLKRGPGCVESIEAREDDAECRDGFRICGTR